jgi:lipopolysaccharide export system permease protein
MFDTLDRYLCREFFFYFVPVHLSLGVLFIGIDFFANGSSAVVSGGKLLAIYLLKLPAALQMFFPLALLLSTLLVLTNMSRQNELLALSANGFSGFRIASTFLAIAAALSGVAFAFFDSSVPLATKRRLLLERNIDPSSEAAEAILKGRVPGWYRNASLLYGFGSFDRATKHLSDVNVYLLSPSFKLSQWLHAKEARYEDGRWKLYDGYAVSYPREKAFPEPARFTVRDVPILEKPSDFSQLHQEETTLPLAELRKSIGRAKATGLDAVASEVTYHERIAGAFTPLVLLLIGIPFALKPLRNATGARAVGFCFLTVFVFLLLSRLSISVSLHGLIPAWAGAWVPNVAFGVASLWNLSGQRRA